MPVSKVANVRKIKLKRFRPDKMQTNRVVAAVGKKGTGKSTVVQDLMWYHQNIPVGMVMSATEESNDAYSGIMPDINLFKDFDADALERLINRQKRMKKLLNKNGGKLPFDHRAFLLVDDCMYDKKHFRMKLIRELFMNGRHWDLFFIFTMQYLMDVPPDIRSNTDYVFALKENVLKNRKKMYENFFGVFDDFHVFDELYRQVTQDWRCLVLDNTVSSNNPEDCVFWYKAKRRPKFRMGADWFWEYSKTHARTKNDASVDHTIIDDMRNRTVHVVLENSTPSTQTRPRPQPQQHHHPPPIRPPSHLAPPRQQYAAYAPRQYGAIPTAPTHQQHWAPHQASKITPGPQYGAFRYDNITPQRASFHAHLQQRQQQ